MKDHHPTVSDKCWMMYSTETHQCPFLGEGNNCQIYATRPNVCVGFSAGSPKCQELRRDHGLAELPLVQVEGTIMNRLAAEIEELDEDDWE